MTWPQFAILNAVIAVVGLAVIWWPRRRGSELDVPEFLKPPVPGAAASPPGAGSPAPGLHIPTTLDCILACQACRQTPAGYCTCPHYCGYSRCPAFTSKDVRWLARLKIGDPA